MFAPFPAGIPTRRRIGSSHTTFIYGGGVFMAIAEIVTGIKTTWAAATAVIETRDAVKLNELQLTMSNQLLELYTAAFSLQEEKATMADAKRDLEKQILELTSQLEELSHYERWILPSGASVHIDMREPEESEPSVYFCSTCIEDRKVTTLQVMPSGIHLHCPRGHGQIFAGQSLVPDTYGLGIAVDEP